MAKLYFQVFIYSSGSFQCDDKSKTTSLWKVTSRLCQCTALAANVCARTLNNQMTWVFLPFPHHKACHRAFWSVQEADCRIPCVKSWLKKQSFMSNVCVRFVNGCCGTGICLNINRSSWGHLPARGTKVVTFHFAYSIENNFFCWKSDRNLSDLKIKCGARPLPTTMLRGLKQSKIRRC